MKKLTKSEVTLSSSKVDSKSETKKRIKRNMKWFKEESKRQLHELPLRYV